jgi:ribosomal protein S18 acetylase RimI-like enzyme
MSIRRVKEDKKRYLELLLQADPDEAMLDRYLGPGELYVMEESGRTLAVAVLLDKGAGDCELMNLSVAPEFQGRGLGGVMIRHIFDVAQERFHTLWVGTADASDRALRVYQREGFVFDHRIRNFFTDHYPHPVIEDNGVQCVDMVCLKKDLTEHR